MYQKYLWWVVKMELAPKLPLVEGSVRACQQDSHLRYFSSKEALRYFITEAKPISHGRLAFVHYDRNFLQNLIL